jgi:hypothetical protein
MMPSGGDHRLRRPSDEATLVELTSTGIEHVRPTRSRWTALFIALFTALTCAGLTATTIAPRLIDRAADRGDPPTSMASAGPTTTSATPGPIAILRLSVTEAGPVVATARLAAGHAETVTVRVVGMAATPVGTITVSLRLGGRIVASDVVAIDPDLAVPGTIGTTTVGIVHWTVDLSAPDGAASDRGDGRAIAEISWGSSSAAPVGSQTIVVSLGDGRASG